MNNGSFYITMTDEFGNQLNVEAVQTGTGYVLTLGAADPTNLAQVWVYRGTNKYGTLLNAGATQATGQQMAVKSNGIGQQLALVSIASAYQWAFSPLGGESYRIYLANNQPPQSWNDWGAHVKSGDSIRLNTDTNPNSAFTVQNLNAEFADKLDLASILA